MRRGQQCTVMPRLAPVRQGKRGPPREPKHLLRICNFVMVHGQVALDKELLVVRIEDCLLDVLAGKGLNRRRDSQKLTVMNSA